MFFSFSGTTIWLGISSDSSLSRTLSDNEDLENEGIFPTREDIEIYFNLILYSYLSSLTLDA